MRSINPSIIASVPLGTPVLYRGREATVWGVKYCHGSEQEPNHIYTLRINNSRYPYERHGVKRKEFTILGDASTRKDEVARAALSGFGDGPASPIIRDCLGEPIIISPRLVVDKP